MKRKGKGVFQVLGKKKRIVLKNLRMLFLRKTQKEVFFFFGNLPLMIIEYIIL